MQILEDKVKVLEERSREQQELATKRAKDIEKHYEEMVVFQLAEKETMIRELKEKIATFGASSQKE